MSKIDLIGKLLDKIQLRWALPEPLAQATLLEQGLYCALARALPRRDAEATLNAMRASGLEWNEIRVSQIQELAPMVKTDKPERARAAAREVREYLQDIFQRNHGYDLEFLRDDQAAAGKFVASLTYVGTAVGHHLMRIAKPEVLPSSPGLVRILDRLGVAERATLKKAKGTLESLAPKGRESEFAIKLGEVVDRWCLAHKPVCQECVLVDDCAFGRKAFRDWKLAQARAEAQRKKDDARREALRRKLAEKAAREAERARKRREAEAAKLERERARKVREAERAREAAAKASKAKNRGAARKAITPAAKSSAGAKRPSGGGKVAAASGSRAVAGAPARKSDAGVPGRARPANRPRASR